MCQRHGPGIKVASRSQYISLCRSAPTYTCLLPDCTRCHIRSTYIVCCMYLLISFVVFLSLLNYVRSFVPTSSHLATINFQLLLARFPPQPRAHSPFPNDPCMCPFVRYCFDGVMEFPSSYGTGGIAAILRRGEGGRLGGS